MIHISIIEDDKLVLNSLIGLFNRQADMMTSGTSTKVETFLEAHHEVTPDVLLLDISLKGGMTGLQGIRPLKEQFPNMEIIILTTFEDSDRIFKALCAGASAYLTKRTPFPKIVEAIYTVHRGGSYMSPEIARKIVNHFSPTSDEKINLTGRQLQIAECILDGLSYKLIADKLMISIDTVRDHIKKIYKKLEVSSKSELIKKISEHKNKD